MRTFRLGRPSPALVVSIIALIIALGGTSYAAFSVPKDSVGSKQLKKNAVTTKKIDGGAVTGAKIAGGAVTAKIANGTITGQQVNASTLGNVPSATNANHATDADQLGGNPSSSYQTKILWARIAPDGTLTTGSGAVSSGLLQTGEYEVIFNRAVTGCAYEATPGSSLVTNTNEVDDLQRATFIRTEPRTGNPNGVFVAIYDSKIGNALVNNAFHLVGEKPQETAADVYRFRLEVPAGALKTLTVSEEREVQINYAFHLAVIC